MKYLLIFLIFLVAIPYITYSYTVNANYDNWIFNPETDFYSRNYLDSESTGRDLTGVAANSGISGVLLNPASLLIENKIQLYYEIGFKNKTRYLPDFYNDDNETFLFHDKRIYMSQDKSTSTLGITYKIDDKFQTGLLYTNKENIYYDGITFGIIDYYGAIVDSLDYYFKKNCSSLIIPISYQHNSRFQLGASINFDMYKSEQPGVLWEQEGTHSIFIGKAQFVLIRPSFGMILKPLNFMSLGASLITSAKKKVLEENQGIKVKFESNSFPFEFRLGMAFHVPQNPFSAYFDFRHIQTSDYEQFKNRNDLFAGVDYETDKLVLRMGYMSNFEYRDVSFKVDNDWFYWLDTEKHNLHYVTFGATYSWKRFAFSGAFLTTQMLSPSQPKQNSFTLSTSLNL